MQTAICKITFHDGSWVKAELPTDASQAVYAYDKFGMFASIDVLPADDAAVIRSKEGAVAVTSRLFVSPCGNSAAWIHPLDLTTGHYPQYEGWTDCTDMDDHEFEAFVVSRQQAH